MHEDNIKFSFLVQIIIIITVKFKMKGKTVGKAPNKKRIERPGLTEDEIE